MVANNIFRLAMILSSGQAQNFQTNLRKLVKLVLYDNFETPIKLTQIPNGSHPKQSRRQG